jgi:asparagine synthetase B (glutamine-hydrolysing)
MSAFVLAISRRSGGFELHRARQLVAPDHERIDSAEGGEEPGRPMRFASHSAPGPEMSACSSSDMSLLLSGSAEFVAADENGRARGARVSAEELALAWTREGESALDRLAGSYALALWDHRTHMLFLQVDQFGIRSLFARVGEHAVYASTEVAPLLTLEARSHFNESALPDLVASRFIGDSNTVWSDIHQVTPGFRMRVSAGGERSETALARFRYAAADASLTLQSATAGLKAALVANLRRLHESGVDDVVILLSGGVDSSLIGGLAVKIFPRCTAVTFSIDNFRNPELERSQEVARRLGLKLHIVRVQDADVARLHPWIISRLQEPPLHYNNAVLVRMLEEIRSIAPVVLSGDLATLYGSEKSQSVRRQVARKRRTSWIPRAGAQVLAQLLRRSGHGRLGRAANVLELTVPELIQRTRTLKLTPEAAATLPAYARSGVPTAGFVNRNFDYDIPLEDAGVLWSFRVLARPVVRRNTRFCDAFGVRFHYPLSDVAALDLASHLPFPLRWDSERHVGKPLLRELCAELVGRDVSVWPKLGFPTPELEWMRGPLAEYLNQSLGDDAPLASHIDLPALRALPIPLNQQLLWTVMTLDEVLRQGSSLMSEQAASALSANPSRNPA